MVLTLKAKELTLLDQNVILLPDRAFFWTEEKLLIIADAHLGKAQIFRKSGIPVPGGTTAGDLQRLSSIMEQVRPDGLLFLGDLIHGQIDNTLEFTRTIDHFRQRHKSVQFFLVTGNHDRRAGEPPPQFRFDRIAAEIVLGPFVFTHQPKFDGSLYAIAGHVHPAVTLRGKGRLKETLPCFCIGSQTALLPAFGSFTGTQVIRPTQDDRIFVVAGDEIMEVLDRLPGQAVEPA